MPDITIFYDVVCPYAYLGVQQLRTLQQTHHFTVRWVPILLGGIFRHLKTDDVPAQTWPASKQRQLAIDLHRQARKASIPLRYHPHHPLRTVKAMRLLCYVEQHRPDCLAEASLRLYKAYWEDSIDITQPDILNQIASAFDIPTDAFTESDAKDQLFRNTEEAFQRGVFGVPSFFIGDKMWWGQDRIALFQHLLISDHQPEDGWPKGRLQVPKTIEWFHDFSSPFSYLSSTQLSKIEERYNIKVEPKPILLGALFRDIGTPNVPMLAMSPSKQRYMLKDLNDWASFWAVPFGFPAHFPVRSVLPLRLSILDPGLIPVFYRAFWAEGKNIADEDVARALIEAEGKDADSLFARIPEAKPILFANTKEAIEKGICGVPSFHYQGESWWGQDRILDAVQFLLDED